MPRRPSRSVRIGGLALAAAVGVAACGSTPAKAVDGPKLSAQIAMGLAQRYAVARPTVTCPTGEANAAGTTFACRTTVDGQSLTINAQVASPDDVRWQPASSVISTTSTAQAIQTRFASSLGAGLQVSCGAKPLVVVAVGTSVLCSATVAGSHRQFRVTAADLAGTVSLTLVPPATGPGSTTPPVTAAPTGGSVPGSKPTLPGD